MYCSEQTFNINSAQTSSTGAAGGTGGNAIASLLTGYDNQATRNMALATPQYRAWEIGDYIQDNWRVSRNLTLNLGLRWDIYTPFKEKNNALSNFDPTDPATLASGRIQVAGAQGVSDTVNIATQWAGPATLASTALNSGNELMLPCSSAPAIGRTTWRRPQTKNVFVGDQLHRRFSPRW